MIERRKEGMKKIELMNQAFEEKSIHGKRAGVTYQCSSSRSKVIECNQPFRLFLAKE